jgi:hypothetical protein
MINQQVLNVVLMAYKSHQDYVFTYSQELTVTSITENDFTLKDNRGVEICLEGQNINHCGKEGHWLETKMGVKHNAKNEPDINGYEMKKYSKKITLGDFTASEYVFSGKNKRNLINSLNNWTDEIKLSRSDFIRTFGNPNPNKNNRHSWSGKCVPTYNNWNSNGQTLTINEHYDIIIYYSYSFKIDIIGYMMSVFSCIALTGSLL